MLTQLLNSIRPLFTSSGKRNSNPGPDEEPKVRSVQEIFDTAINHNFYRDGDAFSSMLGSPLMCIALVDARLYNVITREEYRRAEHEAKMYAAPWITLRMALRNSGLDDSFEARLAIYRDWENRPELKDPGRLNQKQRTTL